MDESHRPKVGRPSIFTDALKEQLIKIYGLGATDKQAASILGIGESTINLWKDQNPEFLESLKEAKELADEVVEASLFKRATGYTKRTKKHIKDQSGEVKMYEDQEDIPPDPTSMIFWLKNRKPKEWRDKQDVSIESEDGKGLNITLNYARKSK